MVCHQYSLCFDLRNTSFKEGRPSGAKESNDGLKNNNLHLSTGGFF
jgi:hypothetical protein